MNFLNPFDNPMKRQFNRADSGMQVYGGGNNQQYPANGYQQKRYRAGHDASEAYQDALQAGKFELRLLIPSRSAGAVIGRGGEHIKALRSKYDASINVPDRNTPERVLTIVCRLENIADCVSEILNKLSEGEKASRGEVDVKVLVHQSHAGAIIGRGGSKIKELKEATECRFKVFQECCPNSSDRVCLITGEQSKLPEAVKLLVEFVKDIAFKGPHQPYDPSNYNIQMCHSYGGFEGGSLGAPAPPMPPPHFDYPPHHHPHGMGPPQPGVGYAGFGAGPGAPPPHGHPAGPGGAPPPLGFTGGPGGEQVTTTQVTIPSKLSGTIIGKRGECINRIRHDSGARIEIDTQTDPFGTDERVITITGTPQQIQMAQYLLQQSMRGGGAGRPYRTHYWQGVTQRARNLHRSDICAICRNNIMDLCIQCEANGNDDECTVAWGVCNHVFHYHCIARYLLDIRQVCPLDNSNWEYLRYGR